ncbi:hypothetical protein LCGC14_1232420 [marine sediment metagenome]|uniref:Uncharacterized protein n=1 Tax=marine sediment metagenome TaxID=412755 RepID=A0A0F9LVC6_9ZZZZ
MCYDIFYLLAKNIEDVPNEAQDSGQLEVLLGNIKTLKEIVSNICRVIVKHKEVKHEDGRDFFTMEQWEILYTKVKTEKFKKERGAIEKGRAFATAYNTPMGKATKECMLRVVQIGYELINKGEIDMLNVYQMNICRLILIRWEEKILAYKKNIEQVRKIIYKEN